MKPLTAQQVARITGLMWHYDRPRKRNSRAVRLYMYWWSRAITKQAALLLGAP